MVIFTWPDDMLSVHFSSFWLRLFFALNLKNISLSQHPRTYCTHYASIIVSHGTRRGNLGYVVAQYSKTFNIEWINVKDLFQRSIDISTRSAHNHTTQAGRITEAPNFPQENKMSFILPKSTGLLWQPCTVFPSIDVKLSLSYETIPEENPWK